MDLLAATIAEHDAYDRVCISSFGVARLHRLRRRLGSRVASAASSPGVAVNRFVPWLTWALNSPAPVLQMPDSYLFRGRRLPVLTPRLVKAVHRAGKQVQVWTVDDSETMARLIDARRGRHLHRPHRRLEGRPGPPRPVDRTGRTEEG